MRWDATDQPRFKAIPREICLSRLPEFYGGWLSYWAGANENGVWLGAEF